jgi:hypothetical protein
VSTRREALGEATPAPPTPPAAPRLGEAAPAPPTPRRRFAWPLFLGLWLVYGATIDKRDLASYDLHHGGAQVMAEEHRFWYREHVPGQGVGTDRFDYDGKVYANKQPGSLMAGALAYSLLRPLGADYRRAYFRTAALVTLLTSALWTAIAAAMLYRVALEWTASQTWGLAAALGYGLGTIAWPYTGTLHHDAMAAAFLFIGFSLMARRSLTGGVFIGLAVTTSMLAWVAAAILSVHFLLPAGRSWRDRGLFVAGTIAGSAPLLVYNQVSFGNPFGVGMLVSGHWVYTPPRLDAASLPLAWEYALLLVGFTPLAVLGLVGALLLPASRSRERFLVLVLVAAQLSFVVFIHADGACQFGPRMLLPILPFALLGVAGFAMATRRALGAGVVAAIAVVSIAINLLGALYGTHFCPHDRYAPERYLAAMRHEGVGFSLPLLGPLGAPHGDASRESDHARARYLVSEARVAVAGGALEAARENLEEAAALAPDLELVHLDAANVAYLQGDLLAAVAALERAVEIDPDDLVLRENLETFRRMLKSGASAAPPQSERPLPSRRNG